MSDRKLVLVDGNGALYRAFFAIPHLTTSSGRPSNAVFGFVRMMRQIRQAVHPTHLVVVFDGGLCAERLNAFAAYKAQRPPMPDALREQFEPAQDYLERSGVPWVRLAGEEADDIIATLTAKAVCDGASVLICSTDKDFYQLVGDRVALVPPSDLKRVMDAQAVMQKTGVGPGGIVDWLALVGDGSDNIPGVRGIGPKTAARLLETFGSIDQLRERISEVEPERVRTALAESWEREADAAEDGHGVRP